MLISLAREGWTAAESDEDADLVILNTCSVRETAEERIRGRLGFYRHAKKHRRFTLVLTGCMAERLKDAIIDEHPEVDVVLGTFSKSDLTAAVARARELQAPVVAADQHEYSFADIHSSGGMKAFVPIMHGCNNWCSYCIVPHVRGREVSRSPADIVAEIRLLAERATKEVTLLGQNVNSYLWREDAVTLRFPGLLSKIAKESGPIRWLRFSPRTPRISPMSWCRSLPKPLPAAATSTSRFRAGPRPFFSA